MARLVRVAACVLAMVLPFALISVATADYQIPAEPYGCDDKGVAAPRLVDGRTVIVDRTREWYVGDVQVNGVTAQVKWLKKSYISDEGTCWRVRYSVPGTATPTTMDEYDVDGAWLGTSYWYRKL